MSEQENEIEITRLKLQFMVSARLEIGQFVNSLYGLLRVFGQEHPDQAPHELIEQLRAIDDTLVMIYSRIRESYGMDDPAVQELFPQLSDDLETTGKKVCVLAERITQTASLAKDQDIQRIARRAQEYIPTILPGWQNHRANDE